MKFLCLYILKSSLKHHIMPLMPIGHLKLTETNTVFVSNLISSIQDVQVFKVHSIGIKQKLIISLNMLSQVCSYETVNNFCLYQIKGKPNIFKHFLCLILSIDCSEMQFNIKTADKSTEKNSLHGKSIWSPIP